MSKRISSYDDVISSLMFLHFFHVRRPPGRDPSFAESCSPAKSIRWLSTGICRVTEMTCPLVCSWINLAAFESCLTDHGLTDPWKVAIHKHKTRSFIDVSCYLMIFLLFWVLNFRGNTPCDIHIHIIHIILLIFWISHHPVPCPHWPWPDNMERGRQTSTSTAHWAIHFANRNAGTFFQDLGRCSAVTLW